MAVKQGSPPRSSLEAAAGAEMGIGRGLVGQKLIHSSIYHYFLMSRFVIAFLPRSKHLNFVAVVTIHSDFGAQEKKVCHGFHFFPICREA